MDSLNYKTWIATQDMKACIDCREMHRKIYTLDEWIDPAPPLHPNCRCVITYLKSLFAGTATIHGTDGADWWLNNYGKLPGYYITTEDAERMGWKARLKNIHSVLHGKMIFGGIYKNKDGHLPSSPERVWYEADINYVLGFRGLDRIVFSNDGLIFVTYDHYETFYEII